VSTSRGKCRTCGGPAALKGVYKGTGKKYWRRLCEGCRIHARERKRFGLQYLCALCGWKGPCDLHRIVFGKDGGAYVKGNVLEVCPNCHRLIHAGQLKIEHQGEGPVDNERERERVLFAIH